jgi:mannose-6-phosphate isomerase-like protein (cupin superfamily)
MILDSPGFRLELLRTRGEVLEMLATYGPASKPPPRHLHPRQREHFRVEEGAFWFEIDGKVRVLQAGESLFVEPGSVHRAKNASQTERAVVRWETRPALRSAQFFEATHGLLRSGRNPLTFAAIAREFRDEFVLASPGPFVQSCVFGLLAPLARALGKGPRYTIDV